MLDQAAWVRVSCAPSFNSVEPMGNECRLHMACSSVNIQASGRLLEFSQPQEDMAANYRQAARTDRVSQPCHIKGCKVIYSRCDCPVILLSLCPSPPICLPAHSTHSPLLRSYSGHYITEDLLSEACAREGDCICLSQLL
jgi:hypothetical protein